MFQKLKLTYKPTKKESDNPVIQLADDLKKEFGGNFGFYMRIINIVGADLVRGWLGDSKQSKNGYARFLFLWKQYYGKIKWI